MKVLRPGYPQTNPILSGLAAVMAGGDAQEAMFRRDALLTTPADFMAAAWEALMWLEWPSAVGDGLVSQMVHVMSQIPVALRPTSWGPDLPLPAASAWEQACERGLA